jgi:hypothetical protein
MSDRRNLSFNMTPNHGGISILNIHKVLTLIVLDPDVIKPVTLGSGQHAPLCHKVTHWRKYICILDIESAAYHTKLTEI